MAAIEYKEKIVAFMDILGFSAMIDSVEKEPDAEVAQDRIRSIDHSIQKIVDVVLEKEFEENPLEFDPEKESVGNTEPKISARMFSDCIVLSQEYIGEDASITATNIFQFLQVISQVQVKVLVDHSYSLRGGVVLGRHFENKNIIFSKGLVDAYDLETKAAIYPRVLVGDKIVEKLREGMSPDEYKTLNYIIKQDVDGLYFLDYLSYMEELPLADVVSYLSRHRDRIMISLQEQEKPSIITKYIWQARFHNHRVRYSYQQNPQLTDVLAIHRLLIDEQRISINNEVFQS